MKEVEEVAEEVEEEVELTCNRHNTVNVRIIFLLNLHSYSFTIIVLLRQASFFLVLGLVG